MPVEMHEWKKMYKEEQTLLMHWTEHVRKRLLGAYKVCMKLAFEEDLLGGHFSSYINADGTNTAAPPYVAPGRLSKVQPGRLPWKRNLIER